MGPYRLRSVLHDWRLWFSLAGVLLTASLAFALVSKDGAERRAQDNLRRSIASAEATRERASARITSLQAEISRLSDAADANGRRIGELVAEVSALQEQVRRLGGQPIVVTPARPASSTSAATSTTSTTRPSTSTPTTTPACRSLSVFGVCLS